MIFLSLISHLKIWPRSTFFVNIHTRSLDRVFLVAIVMCRFLFNLGFSRWQITKRYFYLKYLGYLYLWYLYLWYLYLGYSTQIFYPDAWFWLVETGFSGCWFWLAETATGSWFWLVETSSSGFWLVETSGSGFWLVETSGSGLDEGVDPLNTCSPTIKYNKISLIFLPWISRISLINYLGKTHPSRQLCISFGIPCPYSWFAMFLPRRPLAFVIQSPRGEIWLGAWPFSDVEHNLFLLHKGNKKIV